VRRKRAAMASQHTRRGKGERFVRGNCMAPDIGGRGLRCIAAYETREGGNIKRIANKKRIANINTKKKCKIEEEKREIEDVYAGWRESS